MYVLTTTSLSLPTVLTFQPERFVFLFFLNPSYLYFQTTELYKDPSVYVCKTELDSTKQNSNTPTDYARELLAAVFTVEASCACSLMGSRSSGSKDSRPSLDERGVNAILNEFHFLEPIFDLQNFEILQ